MWKSWKIDIKEEDKDCKKGPYQRKSSKLPSLHKGMRMNKGNWWIKFNTKKIFDYILKELITSYSELVSAREQYKNDIR